MTGSDGIGDIPYVIDGYNGDNYPLMEPHTALLCDVNGDIKVDIRDLSTAAHAFGSFLGHPRWNPMSDINFDHKINLMDISAIARSFGKK
jgi:hypothetical protein